MPEDRTGRRKPGHSPPDQSRSEYPDPYSTAEAAYDPGTVVKLLDELSEGEKAESVFFYLQENP